MRPHNSIINQTHKERVQNITLHIPKTKASNIAELSKTKVLQKMRRSGDNSNTDYIRHLTNSLAGGAHAATPPIVATESLPPTSAPDSATLLYRYGQDTSTKSSKVMPSSIPSLGRTGHRASSGSILSENTEAYIDKLKQGGGSVYSTEMSPFIDNTNHVNFLIDMERNKNKGQIKMVSGSQFRIPLKDHSRCENCEMSNQSMKKLKEAIRSLKLQITRQEEQLHQLKMSKKSDHFSSVNQNKSESGRPSSGDELNDDKDSVDQLKQRCVYYEEELIKTKKVLQFERQTNETVKKASDDIKNTLNLEILDLKNALVLLTTDHLVESLNHKLLDYKQQLEKSENKLSDALT